MGPANLSNVIDPRTPIITTLGFGDTGQPLSAARVATPPTARPGSNVSTALSCVKCEILGPRTVMVDLDAK